MASFQRFASITLYLHYHSLSIRLGEPRFTVKTAIDMVPPQTCNKLLLDNPIVRRIFLVSAISLLFRFPRLRSLHVIITERNIEITLPTLPFRYGMVATAYRCKIPIFLVRNILFQKFCSTTQRICGSANCSSTNISRISQR